MITRVRRMVNRRVNAFIDRVSRRHKIHRESVRGHEIVLEVESPIERYRANTYSTKEPETLEWIERFFEAGDVLYDIGANVGLYSLFAARHLQEQCQVYAFEPEALNYAKLSKNIHLNGLSGTILPCAVAVSDEFSFDKFYLNPHNFEGLADGDLVAGSSLHSFGVPEDYAGSSYQPFHVQGAVGVSMDSLWREWGLEFPDHVKIDVDGLEEKIIAGADLTLADPRLKSILVEVSGDSDEIPSRLRQAGLVQFEDFEAHSRDSLRGTAFEGSVNCVFVRGGWAGLARD